MAERPTRDEAHYMVAAWVWKALEGIDTSRTVNFSIPALLDALGFPSHDASTSDGAS